MLISLTAQIGNEKAARRVMPWAMEGARSKPRASDAEIAAAQAELEAEIIVA